MAEQQQQQQSQQQQNRRPSGRMGRRFTLNPLIFAKEERDARRQSLAQLKLSYYPQNAHRKFFHQQFLLVLVFFIFSHLYLAYLFSSLHFWLPSPFLL